MSNIFSPPSTPSVSVPATPAPRTPATKRLPVASDPDRKSRSRRQSDLRRRRGGRRSTILTGDYGSGSDKLG